MTTLEKSRESQAGTVWREPQTYEVTRFGIINPYGGIWSPDVFKSEDEAWAHLQEFWRGTKRENQLDRFKVEQVKVTVSRIPA